MNAYRVFCRLFITVVLYACNQNKQAAPATGNDTINLVTVAPDSGGSKKDRHYYWEAAADEVSNKLIMKRVHPISSDSLAPAYLIQHLNNKYEHIQLELMKIANDTLFVKIRQSNFLTQQMGSTGAEIYITEATYTLTEINNIGYVHFDFKEGDHAAPGTYARTDFINIKFSSQ